MAVILLGSLALQLYEIGEPWVGLKDYNGAIYGILSRNFIKYGYLATRFGPAANTGPVPDGGFTYYLHHPPLFYLIISLSYHIFGVNEWSARLVPIIFSVFSLFFFFRFVRAVWCKETALFSTLFLAFLPINLYFSRVVIQESSITLGVVLMLWYYHRWRLGRRPTEYWKIVLCFVLFGLIDWPAYYLLPLLALHTLTVDRGKRSPGRRRMVLLPLFGVLLFLADLGYTAWLSSYQSGGGLLNAFFFRSNAKTPFLVYSLVDFLKVEAQRGYHLFTPLVLVFSLFWLFKRLAGRRDLLERDLYVVLLLLFGLIHVVLFKNASYVHEFWLYHLCMGTALSAGIAVSELLGSRFFSKSRAIGRVAYLIIVALFIYLSVPELVRLHRVDEDRDLTIAGMRIGDMSDESERVIVYWEKPLPPIVGKYFRYYGSPIYTKPIPNVAYYADRNIRWGVSGLKDFEALVDDTNGRYDFFLTRIGFLRDGMSTDIKRYLLENFDPVFMLDQKGNAVDASLMSSFLKGEAVPVQEGVIVFEKKGRCIQADTE